MPERLEELTNEEEYEEIDQRSRPSVPEPTISHSDSPRGEYVYVDTVTGGLSSEPFRWGSSGSSGSTLTPGDMVTARNAQRGVDFGRPMTAVEAESERNRQISELLNNQQRARIIKHKLKQMPYDNRLGNKNHPIRPNTALQKEKLAYIENDRFDFLDKAGHFIDKEEKNADMYHMYQVRPDGSFMYISHSEGRNPLNDEVTFEDFKKCVHLAYLRLDYIKGINFSGDIAKIDYNQGNPLNPNGYTYTVVGKNEIKDLKLMKIDGRLFYLNFIVKPNSQLLIFLNTTIDGDVIKIEQVAEITEEISKDLAKLHQLLMKTRNDLENKFHEIEKTYQILKRRPSIKSKKFQNKKLGHYVKHIIPFSCEIECYGTDKRTVAKFSHETPKELGLSDDGSLSSGIGYPIEIQTPILAGKRGEILLAQTCEKLVDMGFKIDKTCGLHIHLDGSLFELNRSRQLVDAFLPTTSEPTRPSKLISLYLFHRIFEDVIISFLPSTRRLNRYCASLKEPSEYHGEVIQPTSIAEAIAITSRMASTEAFELYWYRAQGNYDRVINAKRARYTPSRYYGANFHSLLKDNHFEIRYHSGTLNYEKIFYWINLHGMIMQKCANGEISEHLLKDIYADGTKSLKEMTEIMFNILELDADTIEYLIDRQKTFEGATPTEEILIDKTKKLGVA